MLLPEKKFAICGLALVLSSSTKVLLSLLSFSTKVLKISMAEALAIFISVVSIYYGWVRLSLYLGYFFSPRYFNLSY